MNLPRVLVIIIFLLPITRNNQSVVHGISGKIWLSRRHNKPSTTNFVSENVPSSPQIEANASKELKEVNLTCDNHHSYDVRFPSFSIATKNFDSSRTMSYHIAIVGVVFILNREYWTNKYLQINQ